MASVKKIKIPAEVKGEFFTIEVESEKISEFGGFKYYTIQEEQVIETSQVLIKLSKSPIRFNEKGEFLGLIPSSGIIKESNFYFEMKINTEDCYLSTYDTFKVKRMCSEESYKSFKIKNKTGDVKFKGLAGTFKLRPNGSLKSVRYYVPSAVFDVEEFFPKVQGESLAPGNVSYNCPSDTHIVMHVSFHDSMAVKAISGTLYSGRQCNSPVTTSSKKLELYSSKISPRTVYLWDSGGDLEFELSESGIVLAAKLKDSISVTTEDEVKYFNYYYKEFIGEVRYQSHCTNADCDTPIMVGKDRVVDIIGMKLDTDFSSTPLANLCNRLGTKVGFDPENPLTASIFYSGARATGNYKVLKNTYFYEPGLNKRIRFEKGDKVKLITYLLCPQATSFSL